MAHYLKSPSATLDYTVDWSRLLEPDASITSSVWQVSPQEPSGISISGDIMSGTRTVVMLTGGLPGHFYQIANSITTSSGQSDVRAITLRIEER